MGVRGLTTYINCNQDVFMKKHYLHDTNIVIDGHSLCFQLYRLLNCFSAFGGDYDKIASFTKTFFKNLKKCNITPYIIFDGCHETRKLKTVLSRLRAKLNGVSRLDPVTQDSLQIFPYLLRELFREVLIELKIPYTVCEFEADDEIAALARHLNCPVLSYDSDFFIFNVLYIPFNTLETKPKPIEVDGKRLHIMVCKLYTVQHLCKHFGGLNEELLPLLATLLGNDYVEKKVFCKFFAQLKLHKSKKKKNDQQRSIHALFNWLQNETLDTAIAKILGRLKKHQKHKIFAIIKTSIEGYHNNDCKSLQYFDIQRKNVQETVYEMPEIVEVEKVGFFEEQGEENEEDEEDADEIEDNEDDNNVSEDTTDGENSKENEVHSDTEIERLPDWFSERIRKKLIPIVYLNLYAHHIHFCNPQAEDLSEKDAFLNTLPILRYAFDIITDFNYDNCIYYSRTSKSSYQKIFVGKEYSIERPLTIPYVELTDTKLKYYFQHFLCSKLENLDLTVLQVLPVNFQLSMVSMLWWISYCSVPAAHVHSLIMSYIMLDVIDEKIGSFRGHYYFNNKHAKKLEELRQKSSHTVESDDLFLNKNKVLYEDCLLAASKLLKHFEIADSIKKKPKTYDITKIHSFAQFQCVLHQINSLNTLCASPFESTKYSKSYNGTFIYNIALLLEKQMNPVNFLEQYMKGAATVILIYKSICRVYNKLIEKMNLSTVQWSGKKKRNRRKNVTNTEDDFVAKGFESEVKI